jgi:hypothetical protein
MYLLASPSGLQFRFLSAPLNASGVFVRILNKRHVANGVEGAEMKFDIGFFEFSNCTIEVINFQTDAASILAREHSLGETDRERSCSVNVFEPVASLHFVIYGCG